MVPYEKSLIKYLFERKRKEGRQGEGGPLLIIV